MTCNNQDSFESLARVSHDGSHGSCAMKKQITDSHYRRLPAQMQTQPWIRDESRTHLLTDPFVSKKCFYSKVFLLHIVYL